MVRRRYILLRYRGVYPGVIFSFGRRDGIDEPGLRRFNVGRLHPGRVPHHRIGTPGRFGTATLQRQLLLAKFGFRLLCLLFHLTPDAMHMPHRGRSPVLARPSMEVLEGIKVLAGDAAALGQQGRKVVWSGTEGLSLFQQRRMAGERLLESPAECHRVAFSAGLFTEIVVCRQNLLAAIGEGGNRLGMTPAEGGAPDIPRDANQRVVVRGCTDIPRHTLGFARGPNPVLRDILPPVFPDTIRHVVECCFLRLRARPALGQILPDLGVRHRNFPVVVGPPVSGIEGERRPVDVDV